MCDVHTLRVELLNNTAVRAVGSASERFEVPGTRFGKPVGGRTTWRCDLRRHAGARRLAVHVVAIHDDDRRAILRGRIRTDGEVDSGVERDGAPAQAKKKTVACERR